MLLVVQKIFVIDADMYRAQMNEQNPFEKTVAEVYESYRKTP